VHLTEDAGHVDLYDTSGPQARFYMPGLPNKKQSAMYRMLLSRMRL